MATPILVLVDEDRAVLEALTTDLARRFTTDYQILAERSRAAALTTLGQLAARSQAVALLLAGQRMTRMSGGRVPGGRHALHPAARRILRLDRGDYTAVGPRLRRRSRAGCPPTVNPSA